MCLPLFLLKGEEVLVRFQNCKAESVTMREWFVCLFVWNLPICESNILTSILPRDLGLSKMKPAFNFFFWYCRPFWGPRKVPCPVYHWFNTPEKSMKKQKSVWFCLLLPVFLPLLAGFFAHWREKRGKIDRASYVLADEKKFPALAFLFYFLQSSVWSLEHLKSTECRPISPKNAIFMNRWQRQGN